MMAPNTAFRLAKSNDTTVAMLRAQIPANAAPPNGQQRAQENSSKWAMKVRKGSAKPRVCVSICVGERLRAWSPAPLRASRATTVRLLTFKEE
mmetsp:Transcript_64641/g.140369  ORF Transcript_64641/g.140369 Transcript_64641/m.140369 type:complete len:93 (-) Transcript_64641:812-1090(-)